MEYVKQTATAKLYNAFRAFNAFVEVNPCTVFESIGAITLPSPSWTRGVKLLSLKPRVRSTRFSRPNLNACLPRIQLSVSPILHSGLKDPRVEPKLELQSKHIKPCKSVVPKI